MSLNDVQHMLYSTLARVSVHQRATNILISLPLTMLVARHRKRRREGRERERGTRLSPNIKPTFCLIKVFDELIGGKRSHMFWFVGLADKFRVYTRDSRPFAHDPVQQPVLHLCNFQSDTFKVTCWTGMTPVAEQFFAHLYKFIGSVDTSWGYGMRRKGTGENLTTCKYV